MLNDKQIKALKPKEKVFSLVDGLGLSIQVEPSGSKLWRFRFTFEGKQKLMSLGKYPDVSLLQARDRLQESRKLVASGINPTVHKKAVKEAIVQAQTNNFESVAREWFEFWSINKSPRHAGYVIRRLESDVFPFIGNRPAHEIQPVELVALTKKMCERKAFDLAYRVFSNIGQIYGWAITNGKAQRNPIRDIKPCDIIPQCKHVNYARIEESELPQLVRDIEDYQGRPLTRLAMMLMLNTFVRTSELIGARAEDFDLDVKRQWRIPARVENEKGVKTYGMKMESTHIVPLSRQVIDIVKRIQKNNNNNENLFPSVKGDGKVMSNNTILKALSTMGYKGVMTGHGFRGLASTVLHEQGYDHSHIEIQLAHSSRDEVSAAYNHALYLIPRAKMMQDWSDYLDKIKN